MKYLYKTFSNRMGLKHISYQKLEKGRCTASISKHFLWKLPDSVNKYSNTHYNTIKMKPKDEKPDT